MSFLSFPGYLNLPFLNSVSPRVKVFNRRQNRHRMSLWDLIIIKTKCDLIGLSIYKIVFSLKAFGAKAER